MSWVRLDDGFPDNAKVENLSDRAFRLYITGLCLSARKLSDGRLTRKDIAVLLAHTGAKKHHVTELAAGGLWRLEEGGAFINDYLAYNPTREKVEQRREAARARMSAHRSREHNGEHSGERAHHVPGSPAPAPSPILLNAEADYALSRLLEVLTDADDNTETTLRRLVKSLRLAVGDIEYARECAMGPGVVSPCRVAVAELKKRAAA